MLEQVIKAGLKARNGSVFSKCQSCEETDQNIFYLYCRTALPYTLSINHCLKSQSNPLFSCLFRLLIVQHSAEPVSDLEPVAHIISHIKGHLSLLIQ